MTIDTAELTEMRALIRRFEQLLATPDARAAVDPDGYPGQVAAGELIESAWGNAVVDKLHDLPKLNGNGGSTDRLLFQSGYVNAMTSAAGAVPVNYGEAFATGAGTMAPIAIANVLMPNFQAWPNVYISDATHFEVQFQDHAGAAVTNYAVVFSWIAVGSRV
jgi:hypothetical protein